MQSQIIRDNRKAKQNTKRQSQAKKSDEGINRNMASANKNITAKKCRAGCKIDVDADHNESHVA